MPEQLTLLREGRQTTRYLDATWSRMLMRLPLELWRLGLGPLAGRVWVVVTTTGRSTGLPRHAVIYPHVVNGREYVWCPYGGRAQWYRNLVANPVATVQSHQGAKVVRAVPLADGQESLEVVAHLRRFSASFLWQYLASQNLTDADQDIAENWQLLHLRRLEPTAEPGPAPLQADLAWAWLVPASVLALALTRRRRRGARTA